MIRDYYAIDLQVCRNPCVFRVEIPFKMIGPSQLSRTNARSFQETDGSKFLPIQAMKSSRPLLSFSTGETLPS